MKKYKQFNIKNLSNVKHQYHTLVKSISQTPSENTQNIFKSNSMQFLSPKRVANGINKFNSLITRNQIRRTEKTAKNGAQIKSKTENDDERNQIRKSKPDLSNVRLRVYIISIQQGHKVRLNASRGIRKVRSTSCLADKFEPLLMSGTESLPNITPKLEERLYPEMSSASSTTSEQRVWITSRSSSIASSIDVNNPATSVTVNMESIEKRLFGNTECKSKENILNKSNKFYINSDRSINRQKKKYKQDRDFPLFKSMYVKDNDRFDMPQKVTTSQNT
ncbi:hypothetical protein NQ317_016973 [Molorchus minor]|uniref:Uncharacterized protein n=1 Tax=Molorchus minor TaxID=1323400 RepID=A0ABQ9IW27_9CUCU|nr:hypothetical protein NQ317_016973 [Molorchus minor]